MTEATFWAQNHALTPLFNAVWHDYVPMEGSTLFVEAEVLRAVSRLHYDYYNNGFGNNMSQAVEYVAKYHLDHASEPFKTAFRIISAHALEPTGLNIADNLFNDLIINPLIRIQTAIETKTLTPIVETLEDMPETETIFAYDGDDWMEYEDED